MGEGREMGGTKGCACVCEFAMVCMCAHACLCGDARVAERQADRQRQGGREQGRVCVWHSFITLPTAIVT